MLLLLEIRSMNMILEKLLTSVTFVTFMFSKQQEDLYIKIIEWAFSQKENGFSEKQVKEEFNLDPKQEKWVSKVFFTTSDNDRKLFEHYYHDEESNTHLYSLNEKGISIYLNYKSLQDAKKSSRHANYLALFAIGISIFVALYQIFFPQRVYIVNDLSHTQLIDLPARSASIR